MTKLNYIKIAKKASSIQISELRKINKIFNKNFVKAIDLIANCKNNFSFAITDNIDCLNKRFIKCFIYFF